MKQYWIRTKHNGIVGCTNPLWQLTQGKFRDEEAVYRAYEAQAKALDYEILQVRPHEQPIFSQVEGAIREKNIGELNYD
jgi:hypothetical protein